MSPLKSRTVDISPFRRLYPFHSRFMEIRGLRYHYLDEGAGDPVVMVHGNPTWSFYFRSLITALSPSCRVLVPDHMGCGLSDKPDPGRYDYRLESRIADLDAFLERLEVRENITLVLHDWGGMIGMALAVRYPERISRLVVLNTAAFFPPRGKRIPLRLRLIRDFPLPAALAVRGLNLFSRGAIHMAAATRLSREVRAGLTAPYNCWQNRIAVLRFVQEIPLYKGDPAYATVAAVQDGLHRLRHIPMLICWGMQDFVFDGDYLAEWRRRFPHAEAHAFSEAGHYVLEDVPEKVSAYVRDFLERHPANRNTGS